jgi:riboflavin synthase
MFTGLIEEVGEVEWIRPYSGQIQLQIGASLITSDLQPGDSVAVNGCCLTVTTTRPGHLIFDLLQETLARTNFQHLSPGSSVNLERALAANGRLGGHYVQGHIDCTTHVIEFAARGADYRLEVELAPEFARYAVSKGSIALDGISLTIAELLPESLAVWIIPHTRQQTNLRALRKGNLLNVEFDLLAKYVERMLPEMVSATQPAPTYRNSA